MISCPWNEGSLHISWTSADHKEHEGNWTQSWNLYLAPWIWKIVVMVTRRSRPRSCNPEGSRKAEWITLYCLVDIWWLEAGAEFLWLLDTVELRWGRVKDQPCRNQNPEVSSVETWRDWWQGSNGNQDWIQVSSSGDGDNPREGNELVVNPAEGSSYSVRRDGMSAVRMKPREPGITMTRW